MKAIRKVILAVVSTMDPLSAVLVSICTLSAFFNAVMRYAFNSPLRWSEELCVITLIWTVYTSLPLIERDNDHLHMTALFNALPGKVKTVLNVLRSLVTIAVVSWLCIGGINVVTRNYNLGVYTQVFNWPYWAIYIIIPVVFALIGLVRITDITIKKAETKKPQAEGGAESC